MTSPKKNPKRKHFFSV